ncbi:hypothetical protein HX096_05765 [Empedobacter falsenii]|uniref:hypothetical protein n=1 Tax=Empedobacter falsenii TaxID=343874 RepID=UPI002574B9D6|nr:hypothetical protein [Empedobacter falsenii]MDM1547366.1 hypothetical protein [Empedobacter falsenii]
MIQFENFEIYTDDNGVQRVKLEGKENNFKGNCCIDTKLGEDNIPNGVYPIIYFKKMNYSCFSASKLGSEINYKPFDSDTYYLTEEGEKFFNLE